MAVARDPTELLGVEQLTSKDPAEIAGQYPAELVEQEAFDAEVESIRELDGTLSTHPPDAIRIEEISQKTDLAFENEELAAVSWRDFEKNYRGSKGTEQQARLDTGQSLVKITSASRDILDGLEERVDALGNATSKEAKVEGDAAEARLKAKTRTGYILYSVSWAFGLLAALLGAKDGGGD